MHNKKIQSSLSGAVLSPAEAIPLHTVRQAILELIMGQYPNIDTEGYISSKELNVYRNLHIKQMLQDEAGELSNLEKEVLERIKEYDWVSRNIEPEIQRKLSLGERVADNIAEFGGSWTFIISFGLFLVVWILINVFVLLSHPFDPYPFILLNLILSCLAAVQAPVIMMSQNRKEAKDRSRSEHDYQVNLKAEVEIQQLHEKIDHLIIHQWQRLLEIQQLQMEMLQQLIDRKER